MFRFDEDLKVYVHRDPVDFRAGINSLSILVEQAMRLNPMSSALYVFGNRHCDKIKILGWSGNGFWLMMKRLEAKDHFVWPDSKTESSRCPSSSCTGSSRASISRLCSDIQSVTMRG